MFKEKRLILIEIPPKRMRRPRGPSEKILSSSEKAERMREIKESEEKEQKENEEVAKKLLNKLEFMGLECERCGGKNVREDKELSKKDAKNFHLFCLDCNYEWVEPKG